MDRILDFRAVGAFGPTASFCRNQAMIIPMPPGWRDSPNGHLAILRVAT